MFIPSSARIVLSIAVFIALSIYAAYSFGGIRLTSDAELADIMLPEGFSISVFAEGLGLNAASYPGPNAGPRFMAYDRDVLFVTLTRLGTVVALPDRDRDGKADAVITVIEHLRNPHGIALHDGMLYIAEEHRVIRGSLTEDLHLQGITTVVDNLPAGEGHFTRTILINNSTLYVSVGSSCNVCRERDPRRAAVLACSLTGACTVFSSGLRNAVGLAVHPETGELWATENGRDLLGDNVPPEEINVLHEDKDYGWPLCYGERLHDTTFDWRTDGRDPCRLTEPPVLAFQAHSAPLGMTFYTGKMFPAAYRGDLFVAYHGSWNRAEPTGYKVVRMKFNGTRPLIVEDFAEGWLEGSTVRGRPVDVIVAPDGALLVSDDSAGAIYRLAYRR